MLTLEPSFLETIEQIKNEEIVSKVGVDKIFDFFVLHTKQILSEAKDDKWMYYEEYLKMQFVMFRHLVHVENKRQNNEEFIHFIDDVKLEILFLKTMKFSSIQAKKERKYSFIDLIQSSLLDVNNFHNNRRAYYDRQKQVMDMRTLGIGLMPNDSIADNTDEQRMNLRKKRSSLLSNLILSPSYNEDKILS